jgi:hypothetical protein
MITSPHPAVLVASIYLVRADTSEVSASKTATPVITTVKIQVKLPNARMNVLRSSISLTRIVVVIGPVGSDMIFLCLNSYYYTTDIQ